MVPFGTYTYLFPYDYVEAAFVNAYGNDVLKGFRPKAEPFEKTYNTSQGEVWFVNNAFWTQGIANAFQAEVVAGLEDAEDIAEGHRSIYSSAIHFKPNATPETFEPNRYAKRILLPMADISHFLFAGTWQRSMASRVHSPEARKPL